MARFTMHKSLHTLLYATALLAGLALLVAAAAARKCKRRRKRPPRRSRP